GRTETLARRAGGAPALSQREWVLNHKFVESWSGEEHTKFRAFSNLSYRVIGFENIVFADLAQTVRTNDGEVDRRHQCTERLIRTDIRRRLLAPNMLLASR